MPLNLKRLKRALGGIVAPLQYFNKSADDWEVVDGSDGAIKTLLTGSNVIQPTEIQARYATTIQTHTNAAIGPSASIDSSWIDTDGFDYLCGTFFNNGATTSNIDVHWSNDGTNIHGIDRGASNTEQYKPFEYRTKARYARVRVFNGHTAPITANAFSYLKA